MQHTGDAATHERVSCRDMIMAVSGDRARHCQRNTACFRNSRRCTCGGVVGVCVCRKRATMCAVTSNWGVGSAHARLYLSFAGGRKNIEEHYDAGNAMYMSFLDESMTYSCGIHTEEQKGDLQVRLSQNKGCTAPAGSTVDMRQGHATLKAQVCTSSCYSECAGEHRPCP